LDQQAKPSFVGFAAEEAYLNQADQVQIFINGSVHSKHTHPVRRFTRRPTVKILRRLHEAASARLDDLTAAMVEEYGGVVQFAGPIVQSGVNAFLASEKALQDFH
jgi:acyl-CoA reductase-like NAD-dependent aldehyde dehydrogenase